MSLIGKKVTCRWFDSNKYQEYTGIIIEKYNGVIRKPTTTPSGIGGTILVESWVTVDFYIIQLEKGILKTECSNLHSIINE